MKYAHYEVNRRSGYRSLSLPNSIPMGGNVVDRWMRIHSETNSEYPPIVGLFNRLRANIYSRTIGAIKGGWDEHESKAVCGILYRADQPKIEIGDDRLEETRSGLAKSNGVGAVVNTVIG